MSYIKEFFIGIFGYYDGFMPFCVVFFMLLAALILYFVFHKTEKYKNFKSLNMYNIIWRWEWRAKKVVSLWCYCPTCGEQLVCDDEYSHSKIMLANKTTFFICKTCGDVEKSRVIGGDRSHVLKIVRLEINKRAANGNFENEQ
jgi:predicted RNA-binding Zn-ribbon protein involved in translation (DUF1610 family)